MGPLYLEGGFFWGSGWGTIMVKIMQALGQLDVGYKTNSPASGPCGFVQLASCILKPLFLHP